MTQDSAVSFLDRDGVRLCVERFGKGPKHLLFAHGWISSRRMWYEVIRRLDGQRYTAHAFDFRGCGRSDRPQTGHDFEGYAGDLRAVFESIGEPLTLIGHSMGGRLAQHLAVETPPALERMILLAPGSARALPFTAKRRAMALEAFGSREKIERFQRAAMRRTLDRETLERLVDDALICQYEHWMDVEERIAHDFSGSLERIVIPVLVVAGAADPLAPPSRVKRDVAAAIAGSLFVVLKETGHNLPVESPDEIASAVERFS